MSTGTGKVDLSAQQAELRRTISHPSNNSIYRPKQAGLKFPELPDFSSFAQARQHRKERLVAACRAFALHNLDYGFAGHLTVRDPEFPELYWTNPMAVHFSQVKLSNLILADHTGKVVEGEYALNRAGFVLHAAVHEANPDIVAMCHAHTVYGTAFAATRTSAGPDQPGRRGFYEDHIVIERMRPARSRSRNRPGCRSPTSFKNVSAATAPESRPADREPPQHRRRRVLVHRAGALLSACSCWSRRHGVKPHGARAQLAL